MVRSNFVVNKFVTMYNKASISRIILIFSIPLFSIVSLDAQSNIIGTWQPEDKQQRFEIYEENGKYYGKIIGSDDAEEDKQIKSKIEKDGQVIPLKDFIKKNEKEYCCGTFFSPKNQKENSATILIESDNKFKLTVKKGWLSKSVYWTRVKP